MRSPTAYPGLDLCEIEFKAPFFGKTTLMVSLMNPSHHPISYRARFVDRAKCGEAEHLTMESMIGIVRGNERKEIPIILDPKIDGAFVQPGHPDFLYLEMIFAPRYENVDLEKFWKLIPRIKIDGQRLYGATVQVTKIFPINYIYPSTAEIVPEETAKEKARIVNGKPFNYYQDIWRWSKKEKTWKPAEDSEQQETPQSADPELMAHESALPKSAFDQVWEGMTVQPSTSQSPLPSEFHESLGIWEELIRCETPTAEVPIEELMASFVNDPMSMIDWMNSTLTNVSEEAEKPNAVNVTEKNFNIYQNIWKWDKKDKTWKLADDSEHEEEKEQKASNSNLLDTAFISEPTFIEPMIAAIGTEVLKPSIFHNAAISSPTTAFEPTASIGKETLKPSTVSLLNAILKSSTVAEPTVAPIENKILKIASKESESSAQSANVVEKKPFTYYPYQSNWKWDKVAKTWTRVGFSEESVVVATKKDEALTTEETAGQDEAVKIAAKKDEVLTNDEATEQIETIKAVEIEETPKENPENKEKEKLNYLLKAAWSRAEKKWKLAEKRRKSSPADIFKALGISVTIAGQENTEIVEEMASTSAPQQLKVSEKSLESTHLIDLEWEKVEKDERQGSSKALDESDDEKSSEFEILFVGGDWIEVADPLDAHRLV
ncbi:unnamed protein product, partial [Mesorhabditis belari]|uniref:MSP domain-containing protein n=1 Tax=Mesorhabditis belari TaxID=2138241 RepID=A0AAF3EHZ4_9BILA